MQLKSIDNYGDILKKGLYYKILSDDNIGYLVIFVVKSL